MVKAENANKLSTHNISKENTAYLRIKRVFTPYDPVSYFQRTVDIEYEAQKLVDSLSDIVQYKLEINEPGDVYEQEAARIADQVMGIINPKGLPSNSNMDERMSNECNSCSKGQKQENAIRAYRPNIYGKRSVAVNHAASNRVEHEINNAISGSGFPLDSTTSEFMESRLGYDFSNVKIHTDVWAAMSAQSLGAVAYTIGNDIVFGRGHYQPHTFEGRRLLAHELTHVAQQRGKSGRKVAPRVVPMDNIGHNDAATLVENAGHKSGEEEKPKATLGFSLPFVPQLQADSDIYQPVSEAAFGIIQRDTETSGEPSAAQSAVLLMGPFTLTTFDGLLAASRLFRSQLAIDAAELPVDAPPRIASDDLIREAQGWEPFLQSRGSDPLDQASVNQATVWFQAFTKARQDLENFQKANALSATRNAITAIETAQTALDEIPGKLADMQRAAFLAGNAELLEKILHVLGPALQLSSALLEIHEKCWEMIGWLSNEITHVDELIEKFGPLAELGHKVVAGLEFFSAALTTLRGGDGATEIDEEASKASAQLGLASAAGSLSGYASAYMVYFMTLISVGQACLRAISTIFREHVHEFNRFYISEGNLDSVDWTAEPGGRETFDFMLLVMNASSSADIPTPVPESVDKLMVHFSERFEAGTGEEVPTKGFWFWKHTNPARIKDWLRTNRNNIWAMLYGSITPPT